MTDPTEDSSFWERPETVERFAGRDPDHRLQELVGDYAEPATTRVLDLGCAGGRNTVYLAGLGFDVFAIDGSSAMVTETRHRLSSVVSSEEAELRVRMSRMDDLSLLAAESVDLVVALGILHGAGSREEWDRTLSGLHRVMKPGAKLLVSNHTDAFLGEGGEPPARVSETDPIYERKSGPAFLVDAATLDSEMDAHGFEVVVETATVSVDTENGGRRVTANGLYSRR